MEQFQLLPEFISNHLFLVGAFLVVLALLVKSEFEHQTIRKLLVDPIQATRLMNNEDAIVIDVRSEAEYKKAHIKNAKHAPASEAVEKVAKLAKSKDDAIIVYCNVGNTSARVCRALTREGYTRVRNLKGGLAAWEESKLPVSSG